MVKPFDFLNFILGILKLNNQSCLTVGLSVTERERGRARVRALLAELCPKQQSDSNGEPDALQCILLYTLDSLIALSSLRD